MMENERLLKRLHEIEQELQELKQGLQPPAKNQSIVRLEKFSKSLISYWPFVTLTIAIATAIVAYTFFGVDPFERHRAIKTTRELSKLFSELGDELLYRAEWDAAEVAYRTALEIDKNNTQATYGIFKSQIFEPLEGLKYYAPEVADTKLDYLEKKFPDDYQVYFLRGYYYLSTQDYPMAQEWLTKAINKKRDFAAGYLARGYAKQTNFDIEGACLDYNTALKIAPDNRSANNNVGYCNLLEEKFDSAIELLWDAYRNSPNILTLINLGDAYLFTGQTDQALNLYNASLRSIEDQDAGIENERFVAGEWTYNFMSPNDKKLYVKVSDITQKSIFMHYNLSFAYALNRNFDAATIEFNEAHQLDKYGDYNDFFEGKINSIRYFVNLSDDVQSWFVNQEEILALN